MPIPDTLLAAYRAAYYVVLCEPELVIRIGELNPDLDAFLEAGGTATAAFVTAANPGGVAAPADANLIAVAALSEAMRDEGYEFYRGEGRDPKGEWLPEASVLVVGISRDDAAAIGRRFHQRAIVWVEKGRAPELVLLG